VISYVVDWPSLFLTVISLSVCACAVFEVTWPSMTVPVLTSILLEELARPTYGGLLSTV